MCEDYDQAADIYAEEIASLKIALTAADEAMKVWLCSYADDQVSEESAKWAHDKLWERGTLSYIADVQETIKSALGGK